MISRTKRDIAMLMASNKSNSNGGTGKISTKTVPNTPKTSQRSPWRKYFNKLAAFCGIDQVGPVAPADAGMVIRSSRAGARGQEVPSERIKAAGRRGILDRFFVLCFCCMLLSCRHLILLRVVPVPIDAVDISQYFRHCHIQLSRNLATHPPILKHHARQRFVL